jgi:hypothetical protein
MNGEDDPLIVKREALTGPNVLKDQALRAGGGDQYAIALGRERTRIDAEAHALKQKQDAKRTELQKGLDAATAAREQAREDINAELLALKPIMQGLQPQIQKSAAAKDQYDALMARANLLNQGIKNLDATYTAGAQSALDDFNSGAQAEYDKIIGPQEKNYTDATNLAITLRDNTKKQGEFDKAYNAARSEYENAVTQHDKDYAAFKMYQAKKAMYDQDTANRQADINAGRYAVNPYQFMAQGADLNEINALREQVNAGNLRPNMRVPDAEVAPDEVKDPGNFAGTAPVHQYVEAPKPENQAAAGILGWTAPEPPKADAPLPQASTADVDTSSVHSDYVSPADKAKPPETEKDASGNPVIKPGSAAANPPPGPSNTLQQTATGSQAQPNQQTAQQAATPAPALPAQPTGSTGGQTANTGQTQTNTPTAPTQPEKPKPFTEDVQKEDPDHVW